MLYYKLKVLRICNLMRILASCPLPYIQSVIVTFLCTYRPDNKRVSFLSEPIYFFFQAMLGLKWAFPFTGLPSCGGWTRGGQFTARRPGRRLLRKRNARTSRFCRPTRPPLLPDFGPTSLLELFLLCRVPR